MGNKEQIGPDFQTVLGRSMDLYLTNAEDVQLSDEEREYLQLSAAYIYWRHIKHLPHEAASRKAGMGEEFPSALKPASMSTARRVGLDRRADMVARIINESLYPPNRTEVDLTEVDLTEVDLTNDKLKTHPGFVKGGDDTGTTLGYIGRGTDPRIFEGSADGLGDHPADEDY